METIAPRLRYTTPPPVPAPAPQTPAPPAQTPPPVEKSGWWRDNFVVVSIVGIVIVGLIAIIVYMFTHTPEKMVSTSARPATPASAPAPKKDSAANATDAELARLAALAGPVQPSQEPGAATEIVSPPAVQVRPAPQETKAPDVVVDIAAITRQEQQAEAIKAFRPITSVKNGVRTQYDTADALVKDNQDIVAIMAAVRKDKGTDTHDNAVWAFV